MPERPGLRGAHVELKEISKSYGGARALEAVSLQIGRGSIHALVGENGAGKSTLGKIICGDITPDHGQLLVNGKPVHFHSPRAAIASGVVRIAQELSIVPTLTVAQNVFLGSEPRRAGFESRRELRRRYAELAAKAGFHLDGDANAGSLRTADQQKAEILRALGRDAELIVMDEPTAALSRPDVGTLHEIIRRLARSGTTIVLVSHFLREVLELADEVTILRDGHLIRSTPAHGQTEESVLNAMLGRTLGATFPVRQHVAADAPVLLSVAGLTAPGASDVSLEVRAGEIVGLAGLVGAGRTELARAVCQAVRSSAGTVTIAGGAIQPRLARLRRAGPHAALRAGVAMIPESRKEQGLLLRRSVTENVSLASLGMVSRRGLISRGAERQAVRQMLAKLEVRAHSQAAPAGTLSGGNQQKLLFARVLLASPRVLIADEPTRGVDVGAKRAIYELLTSLAADGMGVLLISSDVEEVLGLAHRVLVMRAGRIVAGLRGDEISEAAILGAAFGSAGKGTP
ncbi:MAG TPA: sugar ABC transporter ATP-binding protein [Streptosporangiaceae bacterium]|nr:sugar ABC transporter ATP-binding protein [Streptosporangiaceae bacterium]